MAAELVRDEFGLKLTDGERELRGDFGAMKKRLKQANLERELLVKAARIKNSEGPVRVIDATAGLGEDSLLLAAAGFKVKMFEYDTTIFSLLSDAVERASEDEELKDIVKNMEVINGDSIEYLQSGECEADVIFLDPMFPERQKSAAVKKKFQLLQQLERPCGNEEELLSAAFNAKPKKIVIKRPVKGPCLGGKKPDYSLAGKAVRYDCFVFAKRKRED
ncbi:MAG: class I SAM-dependent methyltransferase [Acetatifactor sp.]|nr:class I SAM-dependent methyltransferase [Acetatifactor sp.]